MEGGDGKEVKISRDYNVIFKYCASAPQRPTRGLHAGCEA